MADWTLTKAAGGAAYSATLTAHATDANSKGGYTELTASSGAAGFYLFLSTISAQALMYLIDIATGATNSETVVVSNIHVSLGGGAGRSFAQWVYLPLRIAAASRISARCQCNVAASTIDIRIYTVSALNAMPVYSRCTTYGADTTDSGGLQVDPGASAGTKGAYSELSASLTNNMDYAVLCIGNQANVAETDATFNIDLATGAPTETVIQADLPLYDNSSPDVKTPAFLGFPVVVASTTRLAIRANCSITNATDRLFDAVVLAFDGQESSGGAAAVLGGPNMRAGMMA